MTYTADDVCGGLSSWAATLRVCLRNSPTKGFFGQLIAAFNSGISILILILVVYPFSLYISFFQVTHHYKEDQY